MSVTQNRRPQCVPKVLLVNGKIGPLSGVLLQYELEFYGVFLLTPHRANLEASIATSSGSFPPDKDMDNILGAGCRPVISQFIVEECVGLSKETLEADLCVGMTICDRYVLLVRSPHWD